MSATKGRAMACVLLALTALPAVAAAQVSRGDEHQRRAASLLARGQYAPAADELLEAFWSTRNPNFLLGAAQAYESAGKTTDAAAMYFIYLNVATVDAARRDAIRARMVGLKGRPQASDLGPQPDLEPEPPPARSRATKKRGSVMAPPRNPGFVGLEDKPATRSQWYGPTMFLAEGISVGLLLAGLQQDEEGLTSVGAVGMIFSAPIIHMAYGRSGGLWWASWALRGLGMLLFSGAGDNGYLLGYGLGAALDILFVARRQVPVRPSVAIVPDGSTVGVAWSF